MKTRSLIAIAVAACLTSAQARIGESDAELVKRYGAALSSRQYASCDPSVFMRLFHFNGFHVSAFVAGGRSQCEQ